MGLYDNIHAINSNPVPAFVPDRSKQIRDYIDRGTKRYETTMQLLDSTREADIATPVGTMTQAAYKQVHDDITARLGALSQRKDLHNITKEAYELASEAKSRYGQLAAAAAQEQAYAKAREEDIKAKRLDEGTARKYMEYSMDNSTPAYFDESGRLQGGFRGASVAMNVNRGEILDAAASKLVGQKVTIHRNTETGETTLKDEFGTEVVSPKDLEGRLQAELNTNPDLRAMDERDIKLNTHFATRDFNDEQILHSLTNYNQKPATQQEKEDAVWQRMMKEKISSGKSPTEAFKEVEAQRQANALYRNEYQIMLGHRKNDVTDTYETGLGPAEKARIAAEYKSDGSSSDIPDLQVKDETLDEWGTGKDLRDDIIERDNTIYDISKEIVDKAALQSKLPKNSPEAISLASEVLQLHEKLNTERSRQAYKVEAVKNLIKKVDPNFDDKLSRLGADLIASIKEMEPSLSPGDRATIAQAIQKSLETGDEHGGIPSSIRNFSQQDDYKSEGKPGAAYTTINGVKVLKSTMSAVHSKINGFAVGGVSGEIQETLAKAKKESAKGLSVTSTSEPFRMKEEDFKSLVSGSGVGLKALDLKTTIDPNEIDVSTIRKGYYNKKLDAVHFTYKDNKGEQHQGYVDLTTTNYKQREIERLFKSKNPEANEEAYNMADNSKFEDISGPGSSAIVSYPFATHTEDGKTEPISAHMSGQRVGTLRLPDGNFVMIKVDADGKPTGLYLNENKSQVVLSYDNMKRFWRGVKRRYDQNQTGQ